MLREETFNFKVLMRKEDDIWVATCLELGLVTAGKNIKEVQSDLADVISVQIQYAFDHDNLSYLYYPACLEDWKLYFSCNDFPYRYNMDYRKDGTFKDKFSIIWIIRLEFRLL